MGRVLDAGQESESVQSEVLLQLWEECLPTPGTAPRQEIDDLEAWVAGVARHVAINWQRKMIRRRHTESEVPVKHDDSDTLFDRAFNSRQDLILQNTESTYSGEAGIDSWYDESTYMQRLFESGYKDLRRITVERGLRSGIKPEDIAERLGITRNHVYQIAFRLRTELNRRKPSSTDPGRIGRAIKQIIDGGGFDAHHFARLVISRIAGTHREREPAELLADAVAPSAVGTKIRTTSDATLEAVAAALARKDVRLAEILWFLDDATRLPLCELLAMYVYGKILKPLVGLLIRSASPYFLDFTLRGKDHAILNAPKICALLLHLQLIELGARLDRRLFARAITMYIADWRGDEVSFLDLHDPAWMRDYLLSLIDGHRRIPHHMEAERWITIVALGRHLASSRLGHEDVEQASSDRERSRTIAQIASAFFANEVARDWNRAKSVFALGWSGGLVYEPFVLRAPSLSRDNKFLGAVKGLPHAVMKCLDNDSPLTMLAGIRELTMMRRPSFNADLAQAALPRIRVLSQSFPGLPLISRAAKHCNRILCGT
ncbi:hypothetical protein WMF04_24330 [Sorangium sp. So ce260]|uniref:RNA polymerase sigma factor n=1 Tax=Sorangium sp. So ce260 TaxID=3133291 RepID=UPI003F63FC99